MLSASSAGRGRLPALAALGALLAAIGIATPTASAATTVTCPADVTQTFSPALTNTPTPTTVTTTASYGPCINAANLLDLRTGHSSGSDGPTQQSCTDLVGSFGPLTRVIHWSTGTTSTITYLLTQSIVGANIVSVGDGTVTAGDFAGSHAVLTQTGISAGLAVCGGAGVAELNGVQTLTLLDA